ncbi:indoleamine 2,3-dioxygenase 2 isoform X3 [Nycticebus coucang]|uniref:indoleamine 2,3-dioxygenase 2 isoform X3 n=1 Tax=Nycticebus coucang TaxID=9470 RepID=UPI00234DD299|nr:indoleamine 2,3-dioxygenase 2 isoform X3 [Nycticebus coucang]
MEPQRQSTKTELPLSLGRFHISEEYGFLLPNPLKELPDHYRPWMEIANQLPHLIETHQLRGHVNKMPLLNCRFLKGHREQRLARLVLSAITMGYVWQEGDARPEEFLPRNLALPLVEVSSTLGLPPILVHADLVLANWARRNPAGPLEIRNLEVIISFPGGESLRGFVLVTALVEKAAVPGIKALVQAVNAISQLSQDALLQALQQLRLSIQAMTTALGQMHDYVDPDVFYAVIRIFLSGWKDNPAVPAGLMYEGVSKEPLQYSGGSAAQSTVLHAFDEFLGVRHSKESANFLCGMRDYMPPSHKAFIEEIRRAPALREFVLSSGGRHLLAAYNQCVEALGGLRSYHITMVTRYLITAAAKVRSRKLSPLPGLPQALEERGTGGTAVLRFLKSVRDTTLEAILQPSGMSRSPGCELSGSQRRADTARHSCFLADPRRTADSLDTSLFRIPQRSECSPFFLASNRKPFRI